MHKENPHAGASSAQGQGNDPDPKIDHSPSNNPANCLAYYGNIPIELRNLTQWVNWKYEDRDGKITKVPLNHKTLYGASVTNPNDWSTYDEAISNLYLSDGIGFVLTDSDPFVVIDLDDTKGDQEAYQRQRQIYDAFNSYTELSPSGKGVHIWLRGHLPAGKRRECVEVYPHGRFITMTGNVINPTPIADRQQLLNELVTQMGGSTETTFEVPDKPQIYSDAEIIARASAARNGSKFSALYRGDWQQYYPNKSKSEADFALVDLIAFYSDNRAQIARIFRSSGLGQTEKAKRDNYVLPMVAKAFDRKVPLDPGAVAFAKAFSARVDPAKASSASAPSIVPQVLDAAMWEGHEPPPRRWVVDGLIPAGQVTTLNGAGGAGKSLLCQQLATALASGHPFLGIPLERRIALYITCEDDPAELHRRQPNINRILNVGYGEVRGRLFYVSLVGGTNNELINVDAKGIITEAPALDWLAETIRQYGAEFVGMDNVAHFFAGNENDRRQVATFLGLLNSLATETGAAIVLVGHPNKSGDGYSGSTAWLNQVRSSLQMAIPHDPQTGAVLDPNARELRVAKSNFAKPGDVLHFRWYSGAFVTPAQFPDDTVATFVANLKAKAEDETFLRCLDAVTSQQRAVSHNKGTNYAPAIFARMPERGNVDRIALERAMERLFHSGQIRADQFLWNDNYRKPKRGLKRAEQCGDLPAVTPSGDLRQPPAQVFDFPSGDLRAATPLYTTYIDGAANEAAAPSNQQNFNSGDKPMGP